MLNKHKVSRMLNNNESIEQNQSSVVFILWFKLIFLLPNLNTIQTNLAALGEKK